MRMLSFAGRNLKEILRDKLNLFFGALFPLLLILLMYLISRNVPPQGAAAFELSRLTPGMTVFGLSFLSLFLGMLLAKDRSGMFLTRLYCTPMTASDFIFGYVLPAVPIAVLQGALCYAFSLLLGMKFTVNIFLALLVNLPIILFFVSFGLLCGTLMTDRQVGGVCGALLTNLSAWLSGAWFDVALLGKTVKTIAYVLPFANAAKAAKAALSGNASELWRPLLIVTAWAVAGLFIAVFAFRRKMRAGT